MKHWLMKLAEEDGHEICSGYSFSIFHHQDPLPMIGKQERTFLFIRHGPGASLSNHTNTVRLTS